MMTSCTIGELDVAAADDVEAFVADRFPRYSLPGLETRLRITEERVEFRIQPQGDTSRHAALFVHMQITDAIRLSLAGLVLGEVKA